MLKYVYVLGAVGKPEQEKIRREGREVLRREKSKAGIGVWNKRFE